jgi:hypothetical protein
LFGGPVHAALILDNGQSGTSFTGTWTTSNGAGFYGTNSVYSKTAGNTYRYAFNLTQSGT